MACLQSFDPLIGGPVVSKNSSGSLKEDSKDDRIRRQQEASSQCEDAVDQPLCPNSQNWWVEQQGNACHRTFIALGERYEMVSINSVWTIQHLATTTMIYLCPQTVLLQLPLLL